jgi:hypothetical protein
VGRRGGGELFPPPVATQWAHRRLPRIAGNLARHICPSRRALVASGEERRGVPRHVCRRPLALARPGQQPRRPSLALRDEKRNAAWMQLARFTLTGAMAARAEPDKRRQCPLTGCVSRARARASFPVDAPMPWAYQCHPQWRCETCAGGTILALERVPATFLEPGALPRIQRGKLR